MGLTRARSPQKIIVRRKRRVMVRPPKVLERDTGKREVVEVVHGAGEGKRVVKEERPIMERVYVEGIFQEQDEEILAWVVHTEFNSNIEQHEFASKEDADRFYEGFK